MAIRQPQVSARSMKTHPLPNKFIGLLQSWATGNAALILFIATKSVYLTILLVTIPQVQRFAPGLRLFDLSPSGYSHERALSLFLSLAPTRAQYTLTCLCVHPHIRWRTSPEMRMTTPSQILPVPSPLISPLLSPLTGHRPPKMAEA